MTAVERIEHGDTVRTRDHGLAPMAQLVNPSRWSGRALCRLAYHRFDAAAFAAGGKACKPRILGIGADSGHDAPQPQHERGNRREGMTDDSEGIAQALDAAMQASIEAAYDPWTDAAAPKTANQFASLIPAGGD